MAKRGGVEKEILAKELKERFHGMAKFRHTYIDTGFDGYLIIPDYLVNELGEPDYVSEWELGDGSIVDAQDYLGLLEIVGLEENIEVRICPIACCMYSYPRTHKLPNPQLPNSQTHKLSTPAQTCAQLSFP